MAAKPTDPGSQLVFALDRFHMAQFLEREWATRRALRKVDKLLFADRGQWTEVVVAGPLVVLDPVSLQDIAVSGAGPGPDQPYTGLLDGHDLVEIQQRPTFRVLLRPSAGKRFWLTLWPWRLRSITFTERPK